MDSSHPMLMGLEIRKGIIRDEREVFGHRAERGRRHQVIANPDRIRPRACEEWTTTHHLLILIFHPILFVLYTCMQLCKELTAGTGTQQQLHRLLMFV